MKRVSFYNVKLVKEKGGLYAIDGLNIGCPAEAYIIIEKITEISTHTRESFGFLALSVKNTILGCHIVHTGNINSSIVSTRDIFQQALLNNAASIICFHNHPSSVTSPSKEDIETTKRIIEAGKILNINVIDYLIIGETGFTSLKEKGYM